MTNVSAVYQYNLVLDGILKLQLFKHDVSLWIVGTSHRVGTVSANLIQWGVLQTCCGVFKRGVMYHMIGV